MCLVFVFVPLAFLVDGVAVVDVDDHAFPVHHVAFKVAYVFLPVVERELSLSAHLVVFPFPRIRSSINEKVNSLTMNLIIFKLSRVDRPIWPHKLSLSLFDQLSVVLEGVHIALIVVEGHRELKGFLGSSLTSVLAAVVVEKSPLAKGLVIFSIYF